MRLIDCGVIKVSRTAIIAVDDEAGGGRGGAKGEAVNQRAINNAPLTCSIACF